MFFFLSSNFKLFSGDFVFPQLLYQMGWIHQWISDFQKISELGKLMQQGKINRLSIVELRKTHKRWCSEYWRSFGYIGSWWFFWNAHIMKHQDWTRLKPYPSSQFFSVEWSFKFVEELRISRFHEAIVLVFWLVGWKAMKRCSNCDPMLEDNRLKDRWLHPLRIWKSTQIRAIMENVQLPTRPTSELLHWLKSPANSHCKSNTSSFFYDIFFMWQWKTLAINTYSL